MTDQPDLTVNAFTAEEPPPMKVAAHLAFGPGNSRIPEDVQGEWRRIYRAAFDEAAKNRCGDHDPMTPHQVARCKANEQVLRVRHPRTYEEAMALPEWQLLRRRVRTTVETVFDGATKTNTEVITHELCGITIDGKRFCFPVPEKTTAASN
jgi:hypothetical protein